ncbi:3708_t:CDS:2, partial [Racocetra fulgida]
MSNNPLSENVKIKITESQNDTTQPPVQNNTNIKSLDHLSPLWVPPCIINRSDLLNLKYLAKGGYGEVRTALWNGKQVAAKFVERRDQRQLIDFKREFRALKLSNNCNELIKFHGLSEGDKDGEYIIVMQYAESGTLKDYLENNKNNLNIDHKISLCKDILKGLNFLHENDIIHRDLVTRLADFGLSKSVHSTGISGVRGMAPFVDPKLLYSPNYSHDTSTDIYSYGVLMWEISTCIQPFDGRQDHIILVLELFFGVREKPKEGMPLDYVKIYEKCWNPNPSLRPNAIEALNDLENLKKQPTVTKDDIQKFIPEYDLIKDIKEFIKTSYADSDNKVQPQFIKEIIHEQKLDK